MDEIKNLIEIQEKRNETDIQGTLKQDHDTIIINSIEETRKGTTSSLYKKLSNSLDEDWARTKQDFLLNLNINIKPRINMNISNYQPQNTMKEKSSLDSKQRKYFELFMKYSKQEEKSIFKKMIEIDENFQSGFKEPFEILNEMIQDEKDGARIFLEKQYYNHIKNVLTKKKIEFKDDLDMITKFIHSMNIPLDNYSIAYFLLRCGLKEEYKKINTKLNLNVTSNNEYQQAIQKLENKNEPKKTIPKVFQRIEDYLWSKLYMINNDFKLEVVQSLIKKDDPKYYQGNHLLYFKLLLLTGQFELAIQNLLKSKEIEGQIEIIHISLALFLLKKIKISNPDKFIEGELNICSIIEQYIKLFAHTDPREAIIYLLFLRDDNNNLNRHIIKSISRFISESNDPFLLIGKLDSKQMIQEGYLLEYRKEYSSEILEEILKETINIYKIKGRHDIEIELCFLIHQLFPDKYQKKILYILLTMNKELIQIITDQGENRNNTIQFYNSVKNRLKYKTVSHEDEQYLFDGLNLNTLIFHLIEFFNFFNEKKYSEALKKIELLELLPFEEEQIDNKIKKKSEMQKEIQELYPEIIVYTMELLRLHKGKNSEISTLRNFAGKINITPDIAKKIVSKNL